MKTALAAFPSVSRVLVSSESSSNANGHFFFRCKKTSPSTSFDANRKQSTDASGVRGNRVPHHKNAYNEKTPPSIAAGGVRCCSIVPATRLVSSRWCFRSWFNTRLWWLFSTGGWVCTCFGSRLAFNGCLLGFSSFLLHLFQFGLSSL